MGTLTGWERTLERVEEALLAQIFPKEPVEVVDALRRECDSQAVVCSRSRVVVPNAY
ncbi:FhaA domain-containing protein, partial [Streptomyces sp. NPDC054837]